MPRPEGVRRLRVEHGAEHSPRLLHRFEQLRRSHQRPRGHVAVTVQVLRGAVHDEIDAKRDRLLIDRAGEGVVDDRDDAALAARRRDGGDVDAAQRGVDRRFEPEEPGFAGQHPGGPSQVVDRDEPATDTEAAEQIGYEMQRSAVDRGATHDLVARFQESQQRRGRGGLPARQHHRLLGPLEFRELLFDRGEGRVAVARVEVLIRSSLVVLAHLLGVVEHERGGLVDRCGQRFGIRHGARALHELSCGFHRVLRALRVTPRLGVGSWPVGSL